MVRYGMTSLLMIRLCLQIENLIGNSYDGDSNISVVIYRTDIMVYTIQCTGFSISGITAGILHLVPHNSSTKSIHLDDQYII